MKDDREVDDLYVELDEGAIPDGILDYEAHQSGQHDNGCRRPPHSWART
jgi:hypothetical protein